MWWPWRRKRKHVAQHALPRNRKLWAEPAMPPPDAPAPSVRLGFADGSAVALADGDPRVRELKKVADILVGGET